MASKILILLLGISSLHAEKHNKGEPHMTQYWRVTNVQKQTAEPLFGVWLNGNGKVFVVPLK